MHGVLHMIGYKDKSDEERGEMRRLEDSWIKKFKEQDNGVTI